MSVATSPLNDLAHDSRAVIRTRRFRRNRRDRLAFLIDLLDLLDSERVTGDVTFNFSQGTFIDVILTESVELKPLPDMRG